MRLQSDANVPHVGTGGNQHGLPRENLIVERCVPGIDPTEGVGYLSFRVNVRLLSVFECVELSRLDMHQMIRILIEDFERESCVSCPELLNGRVDVCGANIRVCF